MSANRTDRPGAPEGAIHRWTRPLVRFLEVESSSGIVLVACAAIALALANSPWAAAYAGLWQTLVNFVVGKFHLFHAPHDTLLHAINDGLMTIFFFVVGLEIKREVVAGELSDRRKAALPFVAALGGMIAPALIYLAQQHGGVAARGWGIPMATDIAFVVGALALFGRRVPLGLKILLLALAIADDLGAVLVIAVVYTADLRLDLLGFGAIGLLLIWLLRLIGVRRVAIYVVIGVGIWYAFLASGVHPTVAGVLLGLLTPAKGYAPEEHAPLERLEAALHPWVSFLIMPLFALANAGVAIHWADLGHPVSMAVATGLLIGKPLGIVLFSWAAVRLGIARLPDGVDWKVMIGAGFLGGIGFTMSLFIAGLALPEELLDAGKIGTLMGSVMSALVGSVLLLVALRGQRG